MANTIWGKIKTAIANIKTCRADYQNATTDSERIAILRIELTNVEKVLLNLHGRIRKEAGEE